MQLDILSFNLRTWTDTDGSNAWPYRRDMAAELIKKYHPHVVGTQEALPEMLSDLDSRLPEYERWGEGRRGGENGEFNAIYYHRRVGGPQEQGQFWLSETPDEPGSVSWDSSLPRICTWAVFQPPALGRPFLVCNTHLDHRGPEAKIQGARLIWQHMRPYIDKGMAAVLVGDLNSRPGEEPIVFLRRHLRDLLQETGQDGIGTFHGFSGESRDLPIDHVFAGPGIDVQDVRIIRDHVDGSYPSDHFPVMACLQLS